MQRFNLMVIISAAFYFLAVCFTSGQETVTDDYESTFVEKYNKWLSSPIISHPKTERSEKVFMPPNLPNNMEFFCSGGPGYTDSLFGIYFRSGNYETNLFSKSELEKYCPFPEFVQQMAKFGYTMSSHPVQLYSVFPMLGRLYCLDSPDAKSDKRYWIGYAYRLDDKQYPTDVFLAHESFVFTCSVRGSGTLHNYKIYVTDIEPLVETGDSLQAYIRLHSPGSRHIWREGRYKVGDVLEFYDKGHKIINIVAPQELNDKIRGHKCSLLGYVELAPDAVQLENPHSDEIEIIEEPILPKPALTDAEKASMRTWTSADGNNKKVSMFVELQDGDIVKMKMPDTSVRNIPLNTFSQEDQDLIRQLAIAKSVEAVVTNNSPIDKSPNTPQVTPQSDRESDSNSKSSDANWSVPIVATLLILVAVYFIIRKSKKE